MKRFRANKSSLFFLGQGWDSGPPAAGITPAQRFKSLDGRFKSLDGRFKSLDLPSRHPLAGMLIK